MNKLLSFVLVWVLAGAAYALTVQDTTMDARIENGTTISGAGDAVVTGSYPLQWVAVTEDANGQPITVHQYEIRYREVGTTVYTLVIAASNLTQVTLSVSTGSYEGFIQAVDIDGVFSAPQNFAFQVN